MMVTLRQALAQERKATEEYRKKPTFDNEQAMLEAKYIVGLVIGIFLFSALLPSAITALNTANQTGWTATQIAIYSVIGIVVLAVIIIKLTE
jgi:hypothetical protein